MGLEDIVITKDDLTRNSLQQSCFQKLWGEKSTKVKRINLALRYDDVYDSEQRYVNTSTFVMLSYRLSSKRALGKSFVVDDRNAGWFPTVTQLHEVDPAMSRDDGQKVQSALGEVMISIFAALALPSLLAYAILNSNHQCNKIIETQEALR